MTGFGILERNLLRKYKEKVWEKKMGIVILKIFLVSFF